jgi:PHD/YefM family antitoxin component YafN of YafNO toxin-antitoxin module
MSYTSIFGSAAMKPTDTALLSSGTGALVSVRKREKKRDEGPLSNLPTMTASQLKKGGWPGVMAQVNKTAAVAVTNHHRTEAVILAADHYESLVQRAAKPKSAGRATELGAASKEIALAHLQRAFDLRLATLKDGKSLDAATRKRARRGKANIGPSL